ncbi:DUF982 domain-containing protein [Rhizobium tropici]|uniref:DUF982 domain-containing protein n=1 Tax=Rhizobium tropici TaxID=398 RepID=A0A5B0W214_RHITR|nr:DUF982 domain-containing protein [Rhizobium tropici]KAA1180415.1 DUF982 domain-containing protein [Rhizobium tropici]
MGHIGMGRNIKDFGTDPDIGERFVRSNPLETSGPRHLEDNLTKSQDRPAASASDLGRTAAEDDAPRPGDIARDMKLLTKLVMKRRCEGIERAALHERQDFSGEDSDNLRNLTFEPVKISLDDDGEVQIVDSVMRAVECLTTQWPVRYGEAFEDALQTCIDGVAGRASPKQVRAAFIAAAKVAGILVTF